MPPRKKLVTSIDPSAEIGEGTVLYEPCVIGPEVKLGCYVVIHPGVTIEEGAVIGDHAVLGKPPVLSAASTVDQEKAGSPLVVAEYARVGAHATVCCGSRLGTGVVVGDYALVRERVVVGENSVIGSYVVVENDVIIGRDVKIQTRAYITALVEIEDNVFIAPGVVTTNDNYLGRTKERFKHKGGPSIRYGARIGAGAVLLPNVVIGEEAFVAAGAMVARDVLPGKLVMGSPAKAVRDVPEKEKVKKK